MSAAVEQAENRVESENAGEFPPLDLVAPQLTIRAVLTGMVLGGLLSFCNIYSGLKIGWSFNMSVTAALLSFGFWQGLHALFKTRRWGLLENNINQTAASAAASIASAGLVAAIPALTLINGYQWTYWVLVVWTFAVSVLGVTVAIGLRRQFLLVDRLPFPFGIATASTVKEMYAKGREAVLRVLALISAGVVAAALKLMVDLLKVPKLPIPGSFAAKGALAKGGASKLSFYNLGFALDPSLLLFAMGGIMGFRAGVSVLLGALVAWGALGPYALEQGWAEPGKAGATWFSTVNKWMLWPGVALMVTCSLTSFAFSWRAVLRALTGARRAAGDAPAEDSSHDVPTRALIGAILAALLLATFTQVSLFGIVLWAAVLGVGLTFVLAIVSARVSGETGLAPVGPMGKVTQLFFGIITPGNAAANLMAANVTGGSASQCADLLHDMKTGLLIGASPRFQAVAQVFGVLAGSLAGSWAYLIIMPNPQAQLLTEEWPAPAVAAWKAVAEIFAKGLETMPKGAIGAMLIAGALGILLAILEKQKAKWAKFVPSPASIGIAMVIPAYYSVSMFLGSAVALLLTRSVPNWSARFLIVVASGLVAGESLAGVGLAISETLKFAAGR
ncbi:MAG: OPT/YSL family transporter [Polyangiaceae bacterium]|nr:OPT/YSL family transporter [Polyangiaceae bacterium]